MATQRIISGEKTILEKDDIADTKSNIAPAVPMCVTPAFFTIRPAPPPPDGPLQDWTRQGRREKCTHTLSWHFVTDTPPPPPGT